MKVLFLSNMYPKRLGGSFIHSQVMHLCEAGVEIQVLVPVPYCPDILRGKARWGVYADIPETDCIDGVAVHYPRYVRVPGKWAHGLSFYFQQWGARKTIHSLMNGFKPDIVHVHAAAGAGLVGLKIKKKYGVPLVCSLRGSDIYYYPSYGRLSHHLAKKIIENSDQVLSVSDALKQEALRLAKPRNEILTIYNGCDFSHFAFGDHDRFYVRNKFAIPANSKVIIFVGSIEREKGVFELMDAFARIAPTQPAARLMIVGGGDGRSDLESLILRLRLGDKVCLAGRVNHKEIPQYLSAADCFVLPTYSEGLPNVVLEAMACALPIIATQVGGIPEIVENDKTGLLVKERDIGALIKAIEYVMIHEDAAKELGANARDFVQEKFTWKHNIEETLEIYKKVLGARGRS